MANNQNYTLPFGIDPKDFFGGLQQMDKGLGDLQNNATSANKSMQDAFKATVAAGEKVQVVFSEAAERAKTLRDAAKAAGADIVSALSGGKSGKELEDKISKFQSMLTKAAKGGKVNLDLVFNEATIKELQAGLKGASKEADHFRIVLSAAKSVLGSMDIGTEEFQSLADQIAITEGFLDSLVESEGKVEVASKSLKGQLRAMKEELALLEEAGQEGSQRFFELSIAAGKLEDQIGDTAQRIRVLASDTGRIDAAIQGVTGLVGALTAAQGAQALFGSENEDLARSLQKVTAAMAILQGIQAVAQTLNKDSAFSVLLLSRARGADTVAATAEAAATTAEAAAAEGATVATNTLTAALLRNPITLVVVAIVAAVAALYAFSKSNDSAEESVKRLNKALEDEKKLLDLDIQGIRARAELSAATAALRKNSEQEVIAIQGKALQTELAYNDAATQSLRDKVNSIKGFSEEENKTREAYNTAIEEGESKHNELVNQINLKGVEQQKQVIEDRRKMRDEVLQFTKELHAAEIAAMGDQTVEQRRRVARAQAQADTNDRIADMKKEILLSAEAESLRNATIAKLREALKKKLTDIDRSAAKETAELQLTSSKLILEMSKEGIDDLEALRRIEINQLNLENAEKTRMILETYKGQQRIQDDLIGALGEARIRKEKEINLKYRTEIIKQEEEVQTASLNIMYGFKELPRRVELAKQQDILTVQLMGAEKRLQALLDAGKKETDAAVILARAQVVAIKGELEKSVQSGKRFTSLFDLVGLEGDGGLSPKQVDAIKEGAQAIITAYKQVTDFMLEANRQQIDSSTERINAFQSDIDKLQTSLDKEEELRKKGYANTANQIRKDLNAKKKAQQEEIDNRHKLFEEQKSIQRAQLIVDTIAQTSSIITAAANVLEGFSSIPIVGVPLGLAAVGAMIAGFIIAKVNAFSAVNNQKETFGEGGTIDGKPHSAGGKKYRATDGSGDVVELESREEVIKADQAEKYRPLLKAINNDSISSMSDDALAALLAGTGVSFGTEVPEQGNKAEEAFQNAKSTHFIITAGKDKDEDLKAIREDVNYLATKKREDVEAWEDGAFYYERRGNVTTKIRKT